MHRFIVSAIFAALFFAAAPAHAASASGEEVYFRARVKEIREETKTEVDGAVGIRQLLSATLLTGPDAGKVVDIDHGGLFTVFERQRVAAGDTVVLASPADSAKADFYYIIDTYRAPRLLLLFLIFMAAAIAIGRWKGARALVGMVVSIIVIFYFVIPQILSGAQPLVVTSIGVVIILLLSLYLSHGFGSRITLALIATLFTLAVTFGINLLFVWVGGLTGGGSEEAFYLQLAGANLDLRLILLAGILISVLGVLDDVTTAQAAAIEEVHRADPTLGFIELYRRGLSVGREHVASLVNTLVLAYVGASFPLFLLFMQNRNQPWWLVLNSTFVAEEIVRTLVGSLALLIAVPATTILAAWWYSRRSTSVSS